MASSEGRTQPSEAQRFEFHYNGRKISARKGDTIASALLREGVVVFSRSLKFHRPRGYYCGAGRCYSCAMRVNGIPGVRTCSTSAEPGMNVESEGGFPSTRFDALSVFDHIFRNEFEYRSRFIRPAFLVPVYQSVIRRLSSSRKVPDAPGSFPSVRRVKCDALIVGHGVSGSVAASHLRAMGVRSVMVAERNDEHASGEPLSAVGYYESGEVALLGGNGLQIVSSRALLMATGRSETGLPVVNADLPGVVLPEALAQATLRGIRLGSRAVIIGQNELRNKVVSFLRASGSELVGEYSDPALVLGLEGRSRVSRVHAKEGAKGCDLVVLLGPTVPAVFLAQQAGCELESEGGLLALKVDPGGRTSVPGIFGCGGVTGLIEVRDRIASGESAAKTIAGFLGVA